MLELDKSGKFWWLDGSVIEPWEITEKWTELVNAVESANDMVESLNVELTTLHLLILEIATIVEKAPLMSTAKELEEVLSRPEVKVIMGGGWDERR